jgi:polyglutamine-binding protein 1
MFAGHPKACPVVAAAKVRENISNQNNTPEKDNDVEMVNYFFTLYDVKFYQTISCLKGCDNEVRDMESSRKPSNFVKDMREKHQEDRNKVKGKGRVKFNDLDPMDPASYSDIPRYLSKFHILESIIFYCMK